MSGRGGRRTGLDEIGEALLLGDDFRLVVRGSERLAECRVCFELAGRPMKLAKIHQHRQTAAHERALRTHRVPLQPLLRPQPQPRPEAGTQGSCGGSAFANHGVLTIGLDAGDDGLFDVTTNRAPVVPVLSAAPRDRLLG
ncbi:unnamed protein product [Tilletia laevis]|uniref:Uncharacterized protein n=2 Tax=Tilletia TaxID=13289 RepID=A0A177VCP8_9BASI|nr:hypothetical protein CF336_g4884 [Tilletia laevis]KAE8259498.1 hypothetical protein A4X03_0g4075 [Tilletia caries]KAE8200557.1 hypothetical protein CF335_g3933 [Tilletia laevis]CAD6885254.1 unnamed protein product [Tilletia caries]CAD6904672.1 unnamed protein product [Tilletia laevis]